MRGLLQHTAYDVAAVCALHPARASCPLQLSFPTQSWSTAAHCQAGLSPLTAPRPPPRPPPAAASPPTVADAKAKFVDAFKKPLPAIYSTIVQELLVQQHLFRWNRQYQYSEVGAGWGHPPCMHRCVGVQRRVS